MNSNDVNGALLLDTSRSPVLGTSSGYGFEIAQRTGSLSSSLAPSDYVTYTIKLQDTLWDISKRETGNPLNWEKFRELDGSNFTSEEAHRLQINSIVYIPKDLVTGYVSPEIGVLNSSSVSDPIISNQSPLISLDDYTALTVKPQDTLWDIAAKELGDPQDWTTILEADGTNFTEDEARRLQIGSIVYLPKSLVISLHKDEQSRDVVISPTPDLQKHLDSLQNDNSPGSSNAPKDVISEDKLVLPSKPFAPLVQPNFGFKAELDKVFEGKNFDAGLVKAVVVDDGIEGKLSFEFDASAKDDSVKFAFLDPDYAPTLNIERSFEKVITEWETDIFTNLLKWKPGDLSTGKGTGLSLKVGEWNGLDMWVSEAQGNLYDPEQGAPTTALKITVEGDFTDALKKKYPSEEWVKRLDMTKVKVDLAYDAKIAWQPKPFPILKPPLPQPVPVYVNDPLPSYTKPRQPVGINPYPIDEPTRQPEIPPQPIEVAKPQPVTTLIDQPVQVPSLSPVVTDPGKKSNFVDNTLEVISSPAVQNAALAIGTSVVVVGGALLLASTAPVWVTGSVVTAGFVGLATLPFWSSNGGEKS
jgi:LysM repeat protein